MIIALSSGAVPLCCWWKLAGMDRDGTMRLLAAILAN
jgi:hypothetical protein